jgi:quinol monooxygenase YgiN
VIIRVFRAQIHPGKEGEFERFVRETGVPTVQAQAGCSHVAWGQSRWSDQPEFVVVTHWDSVAALEAFAGPRWQQAVIEPEEEHMLAQVFCDHYETTETADGLGVPGKNPVMPRLEHGNEPGGPAQQHQNRKFAKVDPDR